MESSFTFLRIRGIAIGAHWSWLLVAALIAWSLTGVLFPETAPGLSDSTYLAMGLVTALMLFVSILLHELGHAFQAMKEGMEIEGITLWLFGGVARFKGMFPSAGAEFRIAAAGPAVSVALAAVFWLLSQIGLPQAADAVVGYLARINGILVLFNLVPALPLDGGRILRAWLWKRQRNFTAATISAARAGKLFGGVLAAVGLLNLFTGGQTNGLWFLFLGWFLVQAAQSEAAAALVQKTLGGLVVRDLMTAEPVTAAPSTSIAGFFEGLVHGRGHSTYPVVEGDRVVGLVSLRRAGEVPVDQRPVKQVRDVMLPVADVPSVEPDAEIISVMDRLHADPRRAVVVEDGRLQGILSISDVAKAVEIQQARGLSADKGETRRAGLAVWAVVGLLILVAGSALYHPPLVVAEPGPTAEVTSDISIEGAEIFPVNGAYLLTSVRLTQPSALRTLWAAMGGAEVFPRSAYVPSGVDPEVFIEEQREVFRQSQQVAAAAGAAAAGLEVTVSGTGAVVQDVVEDSPAEGVIEPGDVIVSIDGSPVRLATDLPDAVRARPSRTRFTIELERGESRETVELVSRRLSGAPEGTFGIGVFVGTRDFDVQLPFEVSFAEREIGGPSAGLAYALAVADLLDTTDHARGRTVVATGTVDGEGRVGAVGGVPAKAIAALDAGADLFLVPQGEIDQVGDVDLAVRAVASLQDALSVLGADS